MKKYIVKCCETTNSRKEQFKQFWIVEAHNEEEVHTLLMNEYEHDNISCHIKELTVENLLEMIQFAGGCQKLEDEFEEDIF